MIRDLRYALRLIVKNPGFSLLIIFALALGIGATSAIFAVANDFLFRPLPFADPARLVAVSEISRVKEISGWTSPRNYLDWREQNHVFVDMAAWSARGFNVTSGGQAERLAGMRVTASFFPVLGVHPILGRSFLAREDMPNGDPVAVVSYSLWQRRFGGRPEVLGRPITLDAKPYTIVGVMPPGFCFSSAHEDVFTPLNLDPAWTYRGSYYLKILARLKTGVSVEFARSNINAILAVIRRIDPEHVGQGVIVERLRDHMTRQVKPALLALLAAVAMVLLIACANVANMLLARATAREREIAVRRAIGAHAGHIVRQMLTESVLLAAVGAALGVSLASLGVASFYRVVAADLQPLQRAGVDWTVVGFTAALSLFTALLFGLAPAWKAASPVLVTSLKEGPHAGGRNGPGRLLGVLIVFEVALSVVLLAGAGVLIKSYVRLSAVDPGFRSKGVLTVRIQRQRDQGRFCSAVLERARALPGIIGVAAASNLPMTGQDWGQNLTVEGRPFRGEQDYIWACHRVVSRDYFRTLGMRVLRGRAFTTAESHGGPQVVVVNETFAKKAWPNENPIGKRFRIGDYPKYSGDPIAVIGVVADAKYIDLADEAFPEMFFSMEREGATNGLTFVFRTPRDPHTLIASVRGIINSIDPDQPITKVNELETLVAESYAPQRITVLLGGIFGMLALVLAVTGLYGVVSYSVAQRRHELGVRMALGASPASVVRLIVLQGLTLTLSGLGLGIAAALALGQLLNSLLFQVSPHDPAVLFGVSVAFAAVAVAASFVPARRAAATDPASTLRSQ